METPKSNSNAATKVRLKLPLYSTNTPQTPPSKKVTMDDILQSVKRLDDSSNLRKIDRAAAFFKSDGNVKNFKPCSSLEDVDTDNLSREGSKSPGVTERLFVSNLKTPSNPPNVDYECSIPPTQPEDSFQNECVFGVQLCEEGTLVNSKSKTDVTPESEVSEGRSHEKIDSEQNSETVLCHQMDNVPEIDSKKPAKLHHVEKKLNQRKSPQLLDNFEAPRSDASVSYSQRSYDNEANAALSVFDVSDFLSCPRPAKVSKPPIVDSSGFRIPPKPVEINGRVKRSQSTIIPPEHQSGHHSHSKTTNTQPTLSEGDYTEAESCDNTAVVPFKPFKDTKFVSKSDSLEVHPPSSENSPSKTFLNADTEFRSAGGKNVIVSEKSLKFATSLFNNLDNDKVDVSPEKLSASSTSPSRRSLFSAASGKIVMISTENLRKAKNLFDSCNFEEFTSGSGGIPSSEPSSTCKELKAACDMEEVEHSSNKSIGVPSGFSTAGGKHVTVSEKSLNFASQLLESIDSHDSASQESKDQFGSAKGKLQVTRKSMFQAASGKVITVSSENLRKAKNLLESLDSDNFDSTSKPKNDGDDLCTPENVLLLENDNELFESIETPSKTLKSSKRTTNPRNNPASNGSERNCEFGSPNSLGPTTAFNESGIATQVEISESQNAESHVGSPARHDMEVSSERKNTPQSPVLLDWSFGIANSCNTQDLKGSSQPRKNLFESSYCADEKPADKFCSSQSRPSDLVDMGVVSKSPSGHIASLDFSASAECMFKSAAGKSIQISEESMAKAKGLFSDILEVDGGSSNDNKQAIDEAEHCSPTLLDGVFTDVIVNPKDVNNVEVRDSHSPVLDVSGCGTKSLAATQVSAIAALKNDASLSSPDWGEFPDLKSSQAALIEKQVDKFHDIDSKENFMSKANLLNRDEWGEFPQLSNVDVSLLKSSKKRTFANTERYPSKSQVNQSRGNAIHQVPKTVTTIPDSLPVERVVTNITPCDRKRKSDQANLLAISKRPKNASPQQSGILNKLALRKRIREEQCAVVRSKKGQKIHPSAGKLFTRKQTGCRWQLNELGNEMTTLNIDDVEVPISKAVIDITSENSVDYRFHLSNARVKSLKFVEGELIADSCLLAFADDDSAGLNEVTTSFLSSPHVDPKLVPNGWIRNHYRWIVWKLACLERTFPQHFGGSALTLENVLLQLKYRYDREIDLVQRSAFRKLLEGDAAPNKFICCVAAVKKNSLDEGESLIEFELTDGWYAIWAVVDIEMVDLVKRDVVGVGTKLIVHSAELNNCEQGCDPLNVPSDVKLKISTNSVRRVKWFAKMGFASNNSPIPALLCSVLPNGGFIGQVTAFVARKYPAIYMCKDSNGKTVFRNERSQAAFKEQQDKMKSDRAELVYEQVWKEVESKYQKTAKALKFTSKEIQNISDPEVLFNIMDGSDEESIQNLLSVDQLRLVKQYKDEMTAKIKDEVQKVLQNKLSDAQNTSQVTKLLKIRLMDVFTEKHALLTIWRPSEEDICGLREGKAFQFFNLVASGTRDKVLQLSSTRQTSYSSNEILDPSDDCSRNVTCFSALDNSKFTPVFGEIDVAGVVVLVKFPEKTGGVTVVYLSDLEGRYLSITFWTSLAVFGCEDLIVEGSVIGCSNLQWRSVSSQRKIPSVFASEITAFSQNPKEMYLKRAVAELKSKLVDKDIAELVSTAQTEITQATGCRDFVSSPMTSTPTSSCRLSITPVNKKLKLMGRLAEEAPPLSPIPLTVTTRHVFSNFKSPCRTPVRPKPSLN